MLTWMDGRIRRGRRSRSSFRPARSGNGATASIRSTWRWLREHYLPMARIALADTPAFERYDPRFDDRSGNGGVELWLPLAETPQPD